MKKKSLFRKATALICCIAMCITTFMPAIYAVDTATASIFVPNNVNIVLYDEKGTEITSETTTVECDSYGYVSGSDGVRFYGIEDEFFYRNDTVTLYMNDSVQPQISLVGTGVDCTVEKDPAGVGEKTFDWKIKFTITARDGKLKDVTANITPGVQMYNVTFTNGTNYTFMDETGTSPMVSGEYPKGDIKFMVASTSSNADGKITKILENSSDANLKPVNGVYTYNVGANVNISASIEDETYTVTEPAASGEGYTYTSTSSTTVAHGGSFSFYVTPVEGWNVPTVKNGDTVLTSVGNNLYVINNITAPVTITVEQNGRVDHSVVYSTGVGYTASGDPTVKDGSNLEFTVAPSDSSYEIKSVTATAGGKVAIVTAGENNKYKISNVKGDVVISVNAQKKMLDVTVDTTDMGDKATTTAANGKVEYGTQYSFYVTPAEGHGNAKVYINNSVAPINPVNGTQYVVTVTENTTIKIVGAELNSYDITLNNGTGFVYQSAAQSVQHNGTYTFDVKVDEAYNKSEPVVSVNNVVIKAKNHVNDVWTYEIENVTENKVVSVSGLQRNTYKVTLQGGAGYNFSTNESTTVEYNGSFTFRVDIMSGYKANNLVVKYGETPVNPDTNGNYKIYEITDDITVTVSGVELATSKITEIKQGNSIVNVTSGNKDSIAYNGYVTFTVKPEVGYRVENVFVNGERKDALDETYRVNNITSDVTIDVVTVANKLTVNYVSTEKNHTFDETATYTIENISTVLSEKLDDCIVHSFKGWDYNGTKVDANTVDTLKALIADNDNTATLTAEFGLKDDKAIADALLKLADTTKEQTQVGEKYRTTFRTVIGIIEAVDADVDPCVRDYVKVTAHGTLLANSANAGFNNYVDSLKNRKDKTSTDSMNGETVVDKTVFNYYVNCNYTWSAFYAECQNPNNAQIVLRVTSNSQENSLNAAGWVELSIGNTSIYIISGESGQDITVAAK